MSTRLRGVFAPVLTPFKASLEPDVQRFVAHCRWLIDNKAGLAIFGTNSEAASLAVAERLALTDAILEAGIPAARLMPGTGGCSSRCAFAASNAARKRSSILCGADRSRAKMLRRLNFTVR